MEPGSVNLPEVVAEVRTAFERYEAALLRNDVEALNAFFADAPQTLRYGIGEHSVGIQAIRRYRRIAPPVNPGRQLQHTVITTFGRDAASVCTEFTAPDTALIGRQSQMWIRIDGAWRIVAAHVSTVAPDRLTRY